MSSNSMADIAGLVGGVSGLTPKNSTSRKNNTELNMEDFLQLMIVQLQNQTIDDAMDTSEMMNQLVQMQMISAITNMTETNVMSYASSLVGKVVTIGIPTEQGLEEREVLVTGTGVMNGQQVIFGKDNTGKIETYGLNQIMAVGQLPPIEDTEDPEDPEKPGEGGDVEGPGEGGDGDGGDVEVPGDGGDTTPPVDGSGDGQGTESDPQYDGTQGAPTD